MCIMRILSFIIGGVVDRVLSIEKRGEIQRNFRIKYRLVRSSTI